MAVLSQAQMKLEVAIECERILTVLDGSIARMELALRLPGLVADDLALLQPFLGDEELAVVGRAYAWQGVQVNELGEEVTRKRRSTDTKKSSWVTMASGDSYNHMSSKKERQDPEVCRAIHLLCSKPKRLKKIIRQVDLSENALKFMTMLRHLRELVELRLRTTPAEERMSETLHRQTWRRNEQAKLDMASLKQRLLAAKKDSDAVLSSKNQVIAKHKAKIAMLERTCNQDCKKIVSDSERRMVNLCKNSEFRREALSQEVKGNTSKFNLLLAEHLQSEKALRARKYKVESQLASWLEKYDLDIGEKQAEWEEVEGGFNQEKEQMALLKNEFDAQEEEYEVLMGEKEEEYQRELEEKMYIFLHNRSARRIQRYWRAYRERKLARRKARRARRGRSAQAKKK